MNASTALLMLATAKFDPFTAADYDSYAGVTSENPMVGEFDDWFIIVDGDIIQLHNVSGVDNDFYLFKLSEL